MSRQAAQSIAMNIGLAGQPNTGKSTLFNRLTGARQHVGNWPGKTIEQKQGSFLHNGKSFKLIDLPGTYSLSSNSTEELITRNHIVSADTDALIVLIDASQLQRSMYLLSEIVGIDIPVIVACTMVDIAESQGKSLDTGMIEKVLGVPVVPINATKNQGIDNLKKRIAPLADKQAILSTNALEECYRNALGPGFEKLLAMLPEQGIGRYNKVWLATRLIERDEQVTASVKPILDSTQRNELEGLLQQLDNGALQIADARYQWIKSVLEGAVSGGLEKTMKFQGRFDRIATHWFFGKILAFFLVVLGFAFSFILIMPVMFAFDAIFHPLKASLNKTFETSEMPIWLASFITDAIAPGVYITLLMVVFIVAVIFVFGLMEDIGLVARIAFVYNNLMERLGLNGKSVLPFISGFGCNIASVAGSRVIDSDEQRRTTIVTSLAIPCPGLWGVVALVSAIFFGSQAFWVVLSLFAATAVHIAFTAWLFRDKGTEKKDMPGLIMELPPYHKPNWHTVFRYVWSKVRSVSVRAGTAIFVAILLIWALTFTEQGDITQSALYSFGKFFEPVSMLAGLDWRLLLSFLISAFAKEAALGAIAIFFGLSDLGTSFGGAIVSPVLYNSTELATIMGATISKASALAFIYAFYFNLPCMATIATIRSETNSTRFSLLVAGYYMGLALLIGAVAYRVGLWLF